MTIKNLPASVRARLTNIARATNRPFQEILQYYAMERFLYRFWTTNGPESNIYGWKPTTGAAPRTCTRGGPKFARHLPGTGTSCGWW